MQLGAKHRSGRFKLGSNFLYEVLFEFLDWVSDGGMHVFIDGGHIGTELFQFLLVLYQIRVQGIEASFQVLAMGTGHDDEGTEKERVGSKHLLKNDRYECDKGEERNPME